MRPLYFPNSPGLDDKFCGHPKEKNRLGLKEQHLFKIGLSREKYQINK